MELDKFKIIKPISYIILFLSQPLTNLKKTKISLYEKWIRYFREAYDNRNDFLEIINIKNNCQSNNSILNTNFKKN